jgi:Mrp family chromosome partitioning ATPase
LPEIVASLGKTPNLVIEAPPGAGKTTRDAAKAMRNQLQQDGTKIIGTILNDWNPKKSRGGYYGYEGGYYKRYKGYYGGTERNGEKG